MALPKYKENMRVRNELGRISHAKRSKKRED